MERDGNLSNRVGRLLWLRCLYDRAGKAEEREAEKSKGAMKCPLSFPSTNEEIVVKETERNGAFQLSRNTVLE